MIKVKFSIYFILALAFLVRIISIDQSFWLDEATSGYIARDLKVREIINFVKSDVHPPFYYILLHGWGRLFGFSETSLRMLSVLSGVAAIWTTHFLALEVFGKGKRGYLISIVSTLLLATSSLFIYYSQEARMYALETFFAVLAALFFLKILKNGALSDWLVYIVSIVFLGATDYLPLLIIFAFVAIAIISKPSSAWWKRFITCHLPLLIIIFLWLPILREQLSYGFDVKAVSPLWWKTVGSSSLKNLALVFIKFVLGRITFFNKGLYLIVIFISTTPYFYLLYRSLLRRKRIGMVLLPFLIPLSLGFLLGIKISIFFYHRFLFILPFFYLLVADGFSRLDKPRSYAFFIWIMGVSLLSSSLYLFNPRFHRENWRGLIAKLYLSNGAGSAAVVLPSTTGSEAFRYYDPGKTINLLEVNKISEEYAIIWLMRYAQPIFDPDDKSRQKIESLGYEKKEELDFNGVVVWKYINKNKISKVKS